MVTVTVSMPGVENVLVTLEKIDAKLEDLRTIWPAVIRKFHELELRHFELGGGEGRHGSFAQLKPRYRAWKDRYFPARRILELTGELKKSLTTEEGEFFMEAGPMNLTVGSRLGEEDRYGWFLHHGRNDMARRYPLDLTAIQEAELVQVIAERLQAELATVTSGPR